MFQVKLKQKMCQMKVTKLYSIRNKTNQKQKRKKTKPVKF